VKSTPFTVYNQCWIKAQTFWATAQESPPTEGLQRLSEVYLL